MTWSTYCPEKGTLPSSLFLASISIQCSDFLDSPKFQHSSRLNSTHLPPVTIPPMLPSQEPNAGIITGYTLSGSGVHFYGQGVAPSQSGNVLSGLLCSSSVVIVQQQQSIRTRPLPWPRPSWGSHVYWLYWGGMIMKLQGVHLQILNPQSHTGSSTPPSTCFINWGTSKVTSLVVSSMKWVGTWIAAKMQCSDAKDRLEPALCSYLALRRHLFSMWALRTSAGKT